jgi:divalent metal cation (Fe/Co/Zn/Cd) transporter
MGFTRKKPNIRLEVRLKGNPTHEETHRICSRIEGEVRHVVPNSRVDVNSASVELEDEEGLWSTVKAIAEKEPGSRGAQNIHLHEIDGKLGVDFLLPVSARMTGARARPAEAEVEKKLRAADSRIIDVVIHNESVSELVMSELSGQGTETRCLIEHVVQRFPNLNPLQPPSIRKLGDEVQVGLRVASPGVAGKESTGKSVSDLRDAIKKAYPAVTVVEILEEPGDGSGEGYVS